MYHGEEVADDERPLRLSAPPERDLRHGWKVVARKELADHVLSARFVVLLVVLGLAAVASVYSVANAIRDVAPDATGTADLFLLLFTQNADPIPFPFYFFVGFLAPLLGIGFGFDAVNSERSQGTLPRLVSQPIHRDDVINGKFVAGLTVIAIMLTARGASGLGYRDIPARARPHVL